MNIPVFSLAVTVAGTFIGAGFVSGQELWQFFGAYGKSGVVGFALAVVIISLLSGITLYYSGKTGSNTFDKVVCFKDSRTLRSVLSVFQFVFYVGLYVIMTAGVQSLAVEYFNVNKLVIGLLFCAVVTVIALKGITWLMSVFSAIIPLLIAATVVISVFALVSTDLSFEKAEQTNSLLSNWFVSALVFVSYNFFAAIGVFATLGNLICSKRQLICSTTLGGVLLMVLGITILLPIVSTSSSSHDMPMLNVASTVHPLVGGAYAVLLFLAMLGAGISTLYPIVEWMKIYYPKKRNITSILTVFISVVTVLLSQFGFSELIGTVYPIFGYIGFVIILSVIINFIKSVRRSYD